VCERVALDTVERSWCCVEVASIVVSLNEEGNLSIISHARTEVSEGESNARAL